MKKLRHKIRTIFICISLSFAGIVSNLTAPAFLGGSTIIVNAEELPADTERNAMMIILMMMLSSGLRFTGGLTDQLQAVKQAYTSYTADNSSAPSVSDIAAGSSIYGGSLRLTDTINNGIQDFINDYAAGKGLTVGSSQTFTDTIAGEGGALNYVVVPQVRTTIEGSSYQWIVQSGNVECRYVAFVNASGQRLGSYVVKENSSVPLVVQFYRSSDATSPSTTAGSSNTYDNYRFLSVGTNNEYIRALENTYTPVVASPTNANIIAYTYGENAGAVLPDTVLQGESLELKDGIMIAQEQAKLIDMTYLLEYAAQLQDSSIPNAITSVSDIADVADAALEVSEAQTGAQSLPWETVNQNTTTQVIPSDQTQTSDNDISQYKVIGLQNVFPFSIPWDIYYFFKLFNATPEPIQFSYPINVYLLGEFTISVDCSPANDVAAFCRSVFLLLFIFGLIMKTRDIMRS